MQLITFDELKRELIFTSNKNNLTKAVDKVLASEIGLKTQYTLYNITIFNLRYKIFTSTSSR
jgi:hypothetical protein